MNNEPVAWMVAEMVFDTKEAAIAIGKTYDDEIIPLYTHPHPDNLGLAESIIKQQQLKIDNLLENNARLDAEIEALKKQLAEAIDAEKDRRFE